MPRKARYSTASVERHQINLKTWHCHGRHIRAEFEDTEWICPNCSSGDGSVNLLQLGEGAIESCTKLHEDDLLECAQCGFVFNAIRMVFGLRIKLAIKRRKEEENDEEA